MANPPSDKVFVGDCPPGTDENLLRQLFGGYGTIVDCKALPPRVHGGKGAALIRFQSLEEAQWVVENVNGQVPNGAFEPVTVKFASQPSKAPAQVTPWEGGPMAMPVALGASPMTAGYGRVMGGGATLAGPYGTQALQAVQVQAVPMLALPPVQAVTPSEKVIVTGIPVGVDETWITNVFQQYVQVVDCTAFPVIAGGAGSACLRLKSVPDAQWLVQTLHGTVLAGMTDPVSIQFQSSKVTGVGIAPSPAIQMQSQVPLQVPMGQMPMPTMQAASAQYDEMTNMQLDQWVAAKRNKDFVMADSLRAELRARGVEPDSARPQNGSVGDPAIDEKLALWVKAKRTRDFKTADDLRTELRAVGIDPDTVRPADMNKPQTEVLLDRWAAAKRLGDFATADSIRAQLRAMGIEPDVARPKDGAFPSGAGFSGSSPVVGQPQGWQPQSQGWAGAPINQVGPSATREKLVAADGAAFSGRVVEWTGHMGWIQPDTTFDHPLAKPDGKLFVHRQDLVDGVPGLNPGGQVIFEVYADGSGLGAMNVTPL